VAQSASLWETLSALAARPSRVLRSCVARFMRHLLLEVPAAGSAEGAGRLLGALLIKLREDGNGMNDSLAASAVLALLHQVLCRCMYKYGMYIYICICIYLYLHIYIYIYII